MPPVGELAQMNVGIHKAGQEQASLQIYRLDTRPGIVITRYRRNPPSIVDQQRTGPPLGCEYPSVREGMHCFYGRPVSMDLMTAIVTSIETVSGPARLGAHRLSWGLVLKVGTA